MPVVSINSQVSPRLPTKRITQVGHGFVLPSGVIPVPAYSTAGGVITAAQANSADTLAAGAVSKIPDTDTILFQSEGKIHAPAHGLIVGEYYFLSESTAGALTPSEPASGFSQPILYVLTSDTLFLLNLRPIQIVSPLGAQVGLIRNTDVATNINTVAFTDIPLSGTPVLIDPLLYLVSGTGIQVLEDGVYEAAFNIHIGSAGARNAIQARLAVDGTVIGPLASQGYIRNSTGHAEASLSIPRTFLNLTASQVVTVQSIRESTNATATSMVLAGTSELSLKKVA